MALEGITGFRLMTQASEFGDRLGGLEGRVVHAKVLDVQGSRVTLRVEGQIVTAESDVPLKPSAEIDLMVRGVEGGRILMQVVSMTGKPIRPLTDSAISSRLMGIDIAPSRTTIAVARSLIEHDMPVTKENVRAILTSLPPEPTSEQITFQTSALRASVSPSKELLSLQALLAQHIDELPAGIREVFRGLVEAFQQASLQSRAAFDETGILEKLASLPLTPDQEAAKEVAQKLAEFARNILLPTEARLASAILPQPYAAPPPPALNAFVESILLILLSLSSTADRKAAAESMQNIQSAISELEQLPLDETVFIKDNSQLQSQIKETVSSVRETLAELEAAISKNDMPRAAELLQQVRLQMQRLMASFGSEVRGYVNSFPEEGPGDGVQQAAVKPPEIFTLIGDLAQAASQTRDPEKLAELFQEILLRLSLQLLPRAAEMAADPTPRPEPVLRGVLSWFVEAVRVAVEAAGRGAAEQQPRMQALVAELNNLIEQASPRAMARVDTSQLQSDLRMMLGQFIQSPGSNEALRDAAASLARNLQLASFSSAVQHTGVDPTGAIMVCFPIHFRDRVDVGMLKIHTDPEGKKKREPLDPFNANIVLVLDTEFLGLSTTYLNTYPKSLQCVIEVDSKRKKKVVEKYIGELDEALRATVYENVQVEVRQRKRKAAAKKASGKKQIAAIDFRI
ncbi:MAG: hypothetical protein ABIH66_13050 [bacterium]